VYNGFFIPKYIKCISNLLTWFRNS
jgi:hypothetical protein